MMSYKLYLINIIIYVSAKSRNQIPLESPQNLTLVAFDGEQVEIAWNAVPESGIRGELRGYSVRIWNDGASNAYAFPPDALNATIDFFPFSKNFVTIAVENAFYVGPPSDALTFDAPQTVSNPPLLDVIKQIGNNSILIRWNKPTRPNGILLAYKIYVNQSEYDRVDDPDKHQSKIVNLTENETYEIGVSAINCVGESARNDQEFMMKKHYHTKPYPSKFRIIHNLKPKKCPEIQKTTPKSDDYYYDYPIDTEFIENKTNCLIPIRIDWLPDLINIPGDQFAIKYREKHHTNFTITPIIYDNDYIVINNFNSCTNYKIAIITYDGDYQIESKLYKTPTINLI